MKGKAASPEAQQQAVGAALRERVRHLERVIRTIYWAVQDESEGQAIAVYIEQEAQVDLDEPKIKKL